jgi:hypothetical protein
MLRPAIGKLQVPRGLDNFLVPAKAEPKAAPPIEPENIYPKPVLFVEHTLATTPIALPKSRRLNYIIAAAKDPSDGSRLVYGESLSPETATTYTTHKAPEQVAKFTVTNYSDTPLLNVTLTFALSFSEWVILDKAMAKSGPPIDQRTCEIKIGKIDPGPENAAWVVVSSQTSEMVNVGVANTATAYRLGDQVAGTVVVNQRDDCIARLYPRDNPLSKA